MQTVEVEFPEGYEICARAEVIDKDKDCLYVKIPIKKKAPTRITFELISDTPRQGKEGEWIATESGMQLVKTNVTAFEYRIWKRLSDEDARNEWGELSDKYQTCRDMINEGGDENE